MKFSHPAFLRKPLNYLFILFHLTLICSCQTKSDLSDLDWISGTWQGIDGEHVFVESWQFQNDSLILGNGYFMENSDTVFREKLKILRNSKGIYYVAFPENKTQVEFKLVSLKDSNVVFENSLHDFPRKIDYTRDGDSLKAILTGQENGSDKLEVFQWKKVN